MEHHGYIQLYAILGWLLCWVSNWKLDFFSFMSIWITGSSCEEVLTLIFKTENNNQFLVSLTLKRISVTLNSKSSFFTIYQSCSPLPPPYWQSIPSLEGFCPANPQHPGNQGQGNSMRAKGSSALKRSSSRLGPQWFSALNFTLWFQGSENWRHFCARLPTVQPQGSASWGVLFQKPLRWSRVWC